MRMLLNCRGCRGGERGFLGRRFLFVVGALLCFLHASPAAAEEWTAGFRLLDGEDGIGVWYPAQAEEDAVRLGPYDMSVAENAAPAAGRFPLILFSHGVGGHFRSHHLTAAYLARHGFVVAAPRHGDWAVALIGWEKVMSERVSAVGALPQRLRGEEDLAKAIDFDTLHLLGYSLGGATQLLAAGAVFDMELFHAHCDEHGDADEETCKYAPWWQQAVAWVMQLYYDDIKIPVLSLPVRKIALVAPLGQGADEDSLAAIDSEVFILRPDEDDILRAPFHGENLLAVLPNARMKSLPGYHYTFIAPPAPRVPLAEWWDEVMDPEEFSRDEFIARVNEELLEFFTAGEEQEEQDE